MSVSEWPIGPAEPYSADQVDLIALSEANNELMSMHRKLAKQESLVRQANQHKDEVLAMVAHDLRNPLGPISGFSQTLRRRLSGVLDHNDELLLDRIEAQAQRMLRLVDDLMDAAAIQRGALVLDLEDVDLHGWLRDIVATRAAAAARKDICIVLIEPDGPVTASIDRYRMAQVLDNLLSNATKYTPSRAGTTVTVSCWREDTMVRIRVDDQGIGIDDELLSRLFEP